MLTLKSVFNFQSGNRNVCFPFSLANGRVGHLPVISEEHWVALGWDLVDHGGVLGVGAKGGQSCSPILVTVAVCNSFW